MSRSEARLVESISRSHDEEVHHANCIKQRIKAGEGVICSVQSADRDEEYYSAPDRLDIHRDHAKADVLGFGYGQHRCQGEWLSRVELELVFSKSF